MWPRTISTWLPWALAARRRSRASRRLVRPTPTRSRPVPAPARGRSASTSSTTTRFRTTPATCWAAPGRRAPRTAASPARSTRLTRSSPRSSRSTGPIPIRPTPASVSWTVDLLRGRLGRGRDRFRPGPHGPWRHAGDHERHAGRSGRHLHGHGEHGHRERHARARPRPTTTRSRTTSGTSWAAPGRRGGRQLHRAGVHDRPNRPTVQSINRTAVSSRTPAPSLDGDFQRRRLRRDSRRLRACRGQRALRLHARERRPDNDSTYTVTANTGAGDGKLGLNLVDDDSIEDDATNKLGGTGTGNGNFTGAAFHIDKTGPSVQSITRNDPSPTNVGSVTWTVKFDDSSVQGVDDSPTSACKRPA